MSNAMLVTKISRRRHTKLMFKYVKNEDCKAIKMDLSSNLWSTTEELEGWSRKDGKSMTVTKKQFPTQKNPKEKQDRKTPDGDKSTIRR
jgi:hypothetical protein